MMQELSQNGLGVCNKCSRYKNIVSIWLGRLEICRLAGFLQDQFVHRFHRFTQIIKIIKTISVNQCNRRYVDGSFLFLCLLCVRWFRGLLIGGLKFRRQLVEFFLKAFGKI
jgi:hypothetical protein